MHIAESVSLHRVFSALSLLSFPLGHPPRANFANCGCRRKLSTEVQYYDCAQLNIICIKRSEMEQLQDFRSVRIFPTRDNILCIRTDKFPCNITHVKIVLLAVLKNQFFFNKSIFSGTFPLILYFNNLLKAPSCKFLQIYLLANN